MLLNTKVIARDRRAYHKLYDPIRPATTLTWWQLINSSAIVRVLCPGGYEVR